MANLIPKLLYIGSGDATNVYTAPVSTGSYTIIKNINICNTSGTDTICSIHLLEGSAVAGDNNKIISNITVPANNVTYYNTSIVMPANSKIYFDQAASAATLTISGVEYSA